MNEISFARQLAQHVTGGHTLSDEITDWMKLLLLDYYAVTTGGVERSSAIAARSAVRTSTDKSQFHTSSLHGTDLWATPEDAALVNGITAHGLELDDTFEESSLHPAVAVFPAVLALADERGESARSVLRAAAIGMTSCVPRAFCSARRRATAGDSTPPEWPECSASRPPPRLS